MREKSEESIRRLKLPIATISTQQLSVFKLTYIKKKFKNFAVLYCVLDLTWRRQGKKGHFL